MILLKNPAHLPGGNCGYKSMATDGTNVCIILTFSHVYWSSVKYVPQLSKWYIEKYPMKTLCAKVTRFQLICMPHELNFWARHKWTLCSCYALFCVNMMFTERVLVRGITDRSFCADIKRNWRYMLRAGIFITTYSKAFRSAPYCFRFIVVYDIGDPNI